MALRLRTASTKTRVFLWAGRAALLRERSVRVGRVGEAEQERCQDRAEGHVVQNGDDLAARDPIVAIFQLAAVRRVARTPPREVVRVRPSVAGFPAILRVRPCRCPRGSVEHWRGGR